VQSGGPYKLALNRVWSYRVQHAAVAGSSEVHAPAILDLAPAYSNVRISGIGFDHGITKGAWEALYRIGRGKKVKLGGATASRLSDLSSRALEAVSEATRAIRGPMITAYGRLDDAKPYLNRAQSHLRDLLGHASLQLILDLVADNPDTEAEQNALHSMAVSGIRTVWREATVSMSDPLAVARASLQLDYNIRERFGGSIMPEQTRSDLAARVHAVLHEMDAHLTPANRARIRSAASELPLDAWLALAAAPVADMEQIGTRQVWETVARALGVVRQGGPSIGAVLAETDYPEARFSSLLAAHGDALAGLIGEIVRWLVAHEVDRCTLTDIVVLGIADSRGDSVARSEVVSRMCLEYARAIRRRRSAA
jgi:hypothetical protein